MKKTIWTSVVLLTVFVVWYIAADRVTPFTGNARVKAVATTMVPQVSGNVVEVLVCQTERSAARRKHLNPDRVGKNGVNELAGDIAQVLTVVEDE